MTRTRGNGQELTAEGLAEDILAFGQRMGAYNTVHEVEARELARDLYEVVLRAERRGQGRAFSEGMQLGAKVENRVAVEAIASAALHVLGQDVGDGMTDLGRLGQWYPSQEMATGPKGQEGGAS